MLCSSPDVCTVARPSTAKTHPVGNFRTANLAAAEQKKKYRKMKSGS